jgi:tetratricopeptide (TPR) repeat protein
MILTLFWKILILEVIGVSILIKVSFSRVFLMLLIAGCAISCKSAPKPAEQAEPEHSEVIETVATDKTDETPETVADDAKALAEMEEQRQGYAELNEILTQARAKRQEIIDDRLNETSEQRFAEADIMLMRATEAYEMGDEAVDDVAMEYGRNALLEFSAIIDAWWLTMAEEARGISADMRQEALKVKADVAAKEIYNRAAELHNKADVALNNKDYSAAFEFYDEAAPTFSEAIEITNEQRIRAELALGLAEIKITESEKLVEDAVGILENLANETGENYDL